MHYTTTDHIRPILTAYALPFDTHSVEREFRSLHPEIFDAEVGRYAATSSDPLHIFSMCFCRWLLRTFADVIRPTQRVVTNNLRERPSFNQEWTVIR